MFGDQNSSHSAGDAQELGIYGNGELALASMGIAAAFTGNHEPTSDTR